MLREGYAHTIDSGDENENRSADEEITEDNDLILGEYVINPHPFDNADIPDVEFGG